MHKVTRGNTGHRVFLVTRIKQPVATKHYVFEHSCNTALTGRQSHTQACAHHMCNQGNAAIHTCTCYYRRVGDYVNKTAMSHMLSQDKHILQSHALHLLYEVQMGQEINKPTVHQHTHAIHPTQNWSLALYSHYFSLHVQYSIE